MTLLGKRNTLKGHLTRLEDYIRKVGQDEASFTATDIYTKLTTLEGIRAQFEINHEELLKSGVDEIQENEDYKRFVDRLVAVETFLKNVLDRKDEVGGESDEEEGARFIPSPMRKSYPTMSNPPASVNFDLSRIERALSTLMEHQMNAEIRSQTVMERLGEVVSASVQADRASDTSRSSSSKLPTIDIPTFSGEYTQWHNFKDMFTNIVHLNNRLSNVQKMNYLVSNVSGIAKKMVENIAISSANYSVAWDILENHFDDKPTVVHHHIQNFCKLPIITKPTPDSFTELVTTAKSILDALDALEATSRDPWIVYLLLNKLDHETKVLWSREIINKSPTVHNFMTFLMGRMKSLEKCQDTENSFISNQGGKSHTTPVTKHSRNISTVLTAPVQAKCIACGQTGHPIFRCQTFLDMSPADRYELVRKFNRCRKCLTQEHMTRDCTFYTCKICHSHHNTLLHDSFITHNPSHRTVRDAHKEAIQNTTVATTTNQVQESKDQESFPRREQVKPNDQSTTNAIITSTTSTQSTKRVFLETAVVRVLDKYGIPHQCRALLDSGAQVNLLSQSLFQSLKLPRSLSNLFIGRVVDGGSTSKFQTDCNIQSQNSDVHFVMTCQIVPSVLQQRLPNWEVRQEDIPIPSGIELADPTWYFPQAIDLLIGNEFYNEIYTDKVLRLGQGLPVLKDSCFGWVISGAHAAMHPNQPVVCATTTLASIDSSLKKFWEVEEIDTSKIKVPDHEIVENIFRTTTTRDSTGRFVVHIPFKPMLARLHNNLPNATRQFLHLEKRLATKPDLHQQYHAAMQENFDLKFFEEIQPQEIQKPSYYLPHHCVAKQTSNGTKIRIVMNASSKSQTGLSLNDVAMIGPTVQPDILTILLRFREHPIAFSCDITKMYPQVLIHSSHRDYHRILWRFDSSEPIRHFRARGVCFGVTSSPYLATRVLLELAAQSENDFPLASQTLRQNFYVDDCLKSCATIEEALACQAQLIELLESAGMTLAKWCANDCRILGNAHLNEDHDLLSDLSKALGMRWHPQDDTFSYQLSKDFSLAQTKREILSSVASLYDPLGLVAPVIVIGKLILQEIWKENVEWDQSVPSVIAQRWQEFSSNLSQINEISIQRSIHQSVSTVRGSIHVFCDSSTVAYGVVAYMVTSHESTHISSKIIVAKSRIAPVRTITIPKLELCAALMGANLLHKIRQALPFHEYYMWTDSTIVLGQIRSNKTKLDSFTMHRLSEIHRLTDVARWQHVPGIFNPADIVSRGAYPSDLKNSTLWWKGPDFLLQGTAAWPIDPYSYMVEAFIVAKKIDNPDPHPIEHILKSTNNFTKMKRILAYVLRFRSTNSCHGYLTIEELHEAEFRLISFAQSRYLPKVKIALRDGSLGKSKQFAGIRHLSPFLDSKGLIRVGGRLSQARESYDLRHPILLPKCHLAHCIATDIHRQNYHAGPQLLLSTMRQKYWPLGGRNLTRKVVRTCVTCWRQNPPPQGQIMGDLPEARLNHVAPFTTCGVDFCGPFLTRPNYRRGGVSYKTYICVFVCFSTKAVHLEVVGNLTTESFVAALRRFVARRAVPDEIYCDNATNFKGAHALLSALLEEVASDARFLQETLVKEIKWRFSPPRTPHHGGLYEAVVKSLKYHLVREVGQTILTFEELTTVVTQIESILNSRPISPLSEDPNESLPLTPGHFLVGRPLNQLPDRIYSDISPNVLTRWQLCQKLLQHFTKRWRTEYLHTLQRRSKWLSESPNLNVGDVVVVCDDQSPSFSWPLGIVQEVHLGQDGRCRVVTVKTARGTYKRGIQRIARL